MKPVSKRSPVKCDHAPRKARCPACGRQTAFTFLGEQRWPETVAQTLGIPAVVEQWLCKRCNTTITELAGQ